MTEPAHVQRTVPETLANKASKAYIFHATNLISKEKKPLE
jgi:hypothetical protein